MAIQIFLLNFLFDLGLWWGPRLGRVQKRGPELTDTPWGFVSSQGIPYVYIHYYSIMSLIII